MTTVAIIQARMGSSRLPGKVMKSIAGVPAIEILIRRLSKSKQIDKIVIATSVAPNNDDLANHVEGLGFICVRGSENDVLGRYLDAASLSKASVIVRLTGDCPLVDANIVDQTILGFLNGSFDYYSNADPPTFPDGLDVEVFSFSALNKSAEIAKSTDEREHVTLHLRNSGLFKTGSFKSAVDYSGLRWTLDEAADLDVIRNIFRKFSPNIYFGWEEVIDLHKNLPNLFKGNQDIDRNQGLKINKGQKLWKHAKNIIPGGNMLLSKRSEMFLPEQWPAYFSRANGCQVWDLDERCYIDMSLMGVGTNILGYGNPEVDSAVQKVVSSGNMSTLNAPEEVYLAEKLIDMHPWADMARFARSGGEANSIAIRIARAASRRDKVAVCGYHGWHDWYLSANLGNEEALAGHLLPGLEPAGVPKNLAGTVYPFNYNNFEELKDIVDKNDIGVIKMEVLRNEEPKNNFLQKVRDLATSKDIVLIFDECTSGFRETFGGLHKKYDVEPDLAIFGKALGNGYAVTAVIGRQSIMEVAQNTFISSTFWTERIGSAAALKTLEIMEREQSWKEISSRGEYIRERWAELANKYNLDLKFWGLSALSGFSFGSSKELEYKTLISQEMLKKGYLSGNSVYVCMAHTVSVVDKYIEKLDPIFQTISECEDGRPVEELLEGPPCHSGFKRLN